MNPETIMYLIPLGGMAVGSLFLVGVYKLAVRWFDARHQRQIGAAPEDLERLRTELAAVPDLRERVTELEERLDFAERLLAQRPDPDRLAPGA